MKQPIDLNVLSFEPADVYHAKAKTGDYLSSHQLIDFMHCPKLYRKKQLGLIADKDSQTFLLGRATHARILEGPDAFDEQFAVGGPINPRTGNYFGSDTKAFAKWVAEQGKPFISPKDHDLIRNLASGVAEQEEACELLLHGRAEGVVRTEYRGVPSQIRIDWLNPVQGIVDLKTCDNVDTFERKALHEFRYQNQLAFYRSVLAQAVGKLPYVIPVWVIAVEKREPFRCGLWLMGSGELASAQRQNEDAIARLCECRRTNIWTTGYEGVRILGAA